MAKDKDSKMKSKKRKHSHKNTPSPAIIIKQSKMGSNHDFIDSQKLSSDHSSDDVKEIPTTTDEIASHVDDDHSPGPELISPGIKQFILSDNEALIILQHPIQVPLMGKVLLCSFGGDLDVYGFQLTEHTEYHEIYSPRSHSSVMLKTLRPLSDIEKTLDAIKELTKKKKVLKAVSKKSVVLCLKTLQSQCCDFITKYHPFRELFVPKREFSEIGEVGCSLVPDDLGEPIKTLDIPKEHIMLLERLTLRVGSKNRMKSPVVVICGARNSGKSTLCRCLVNRFFSSTDRVAFLDCDVGQTEFTAPCFVSLTILDKPLLGPPFTHQKNPDISCCFGAMSPADNPGFYLTCIEKCFHGYSSQFSETPLVVNTMGWNQGLGLLLLIDTLRILNPDWLIKIDCVNQNTNFPSLDSSLVNQMESYRSSGVPCFEEIEYEYVVLHTALSTTHSKGAYANPEHRLMTILSRLSHCYPSTCVDTPFYCIRPYEVSWSRVALHVPYADVARSHALLAFNNSLVALCKVQQNEIVPSSDGAPQPMFLSKTFPVHSLGIGYFRGVDMEKKTFFILTEVAQPHLNEVNCLMRLALDPPLPLLTEQPFGLVPHLGAPNTTIGSSALKRQKHKKRRQYDRT